MSTHTTTPPGHETPIAKDGSTGPGCAKHDPIIVADDVTRTFGALRAVDVDHLEIPRHRITALIGPNGAGKTTLFNLLTGFDTPQSGEWTFDGRPLAGVPSHRVAAMGMVRTFQLTKVLGKLSVIENMRLGATGQTGERLRTALFPWTWRKQEAEVTARADALLEKFRLDAKREDYAASMSGGQRKLLEMARALMTEPTLVMLDEPMAGVNPALKQSLLDHISGLKAAGMTVLFVEHDMHMVRHIADWVVVMAEGRVVAEGTPDTVMRDQAVIDAYLGAHHDVDLGAAGGAERLEAQLEDDSESVVGTDAAGMLGETDMARERPLRDVPDDGPSATGPSASTADTGSGGTESGSNGPGPTDETRRS